MKKVFVPIGVFLLLCLITTIIVLYGNGYRFGITQGQLNFGETGILVTKSVPNGAQVKINGHLTTATDNTINLVPGKYNVEIDKEGYFPWKKTISVQKQVVSQANALLFPTSPSSLQAITNLGVSNAVMDPSQTKIAYTVASQSAQKNGVYILDISSRPLLTLQTGSIQITDDTAALFSASKLFWSPDSSQLIATIGDQFSGSTSYLLNSTGLNQSPQDVTETLPAITADWQLRTAQKNKAQLASLPQQLRQYATLDFTNMTLSPDETMILYQASQSATLPFIKQPRLIGLDSTQEQRNLQKGAYYIYDIKNDQNFVLPLDKEDLGRTFAPGELFLQWFADSRHIVYIHKQKIDIMEYDGNNQTTIYAGPFIDTSVFTAADDTSKIVILTNFGNTSIQPNLYSISLH